MGAASISRWDKEAVMNSLKISLCHSPPPAIRTRWNDPTEFFYEFLSLGRQPHFLPSPPSCREQPRKPISQPREYGGTDMHPTSSEERCSTFWPRRSLSVFSTRLEELSWMQKVPAGISTAILPPPSCEVPLRFIPLRTSTALLQILSDYT